MAKKKGGNGGSGDTTTGGSAPADRVNAGAGSGGPQPAAAGDLIGGRPAAEVRRRLGLDDSATINDVAGKLAEHYGASSPADLISIGLEMDYYVGGLFGDAETNVDPTTPRSETPVSGAGSTEPTRPGDSARRNRGGRQKLPGQDEVKSFLEGANTLADLESASARVSPKGTVVRFKRGNPKPGDAKTAGDSKAEDKKPDNKNPHAVGSEDWSKWQTEKGLNPHLPGSKEWSQYNAAQRNMDLYNQGQRPAFGGGLQNWMAENKPTIDFLKKAAIRVGGAAALTGGGLAAWDYLDDSENRPKEGPAMQPAAPAMPQGSPALGNRSYYQVPNPAGRPLNPALIDRVQRSRQ